MTATLQINHLKSLLPHHDEIEEFIYTQLKDGEPETVTHEFLHTCGSVLMGKVSNELLRIANGASSRLCQMVRLWALVHKPPHQERSKEIIWHRHMCAKSMVYYLRMPRDSVYPEGAFAFLADEFSHFITPNEGTVILFDHSLCHDSVPLLTSQETRIVLAADFEWL